MFRVPRGAQGERIGRDLRRESGPACVASYITEYWTLHPTRSGATVQLRPILFAALLLVATTPLLAQTDTTRVQVSFDGADLREVL